MSDTEYLAQRERQERHRAEQARDPAIAAIHRDLAERYRERMQSVDADYVLRIVQ